jgi:hypothetical protein
MPSNSLHRWQSNAAKAMDEIEAAHAAIGGVGRGRRYATQQIDQAYVMLLSGHFQGFCRDLHTESVDAICTHGTAHDPRYNILRQLLTQGRKLDSGNANEGNLGSDFNRLGFKFCDAIKTRRPSNQRLLRTLGVLNEWRNAIAHQDFDPVKLGGRTTIRLTDVRRWRRTCERLAVQFDFVVGDHLATITGVRPW